jgi:hypothetical protein
MCSNKDIQELLPAYLEQGLSGPDQTLVEGHLAMCGDCSAELALLRALAEEPVPDPGDAFWATFPDRVHREIRLQEDAGKEGAPFGGMRAWLRLSRWVWATAVVVALCAVAWWTMRPLPPPQVAAKPADDISAYEDVLVPEPSAVTELSSAELDSLDSWANNELAPLREGVTDLFMNGPDGTIESSLAEMNKQELKQLSSMLDSQKEEIPI